MTLTLSQAQARISKEELPSSEAALLLNEVATCPHCRDDGTCREIEFCNTEDVRYNEVTEEPF